jgi:hypothetical protein
MAQGYFIGLTECELLDLKAKALSLIMDGKTQVQMGGTMTELYRHQGMVG